MNVYVIGAGMVPFGRYPDRGAEQLAAQAALAAIADADIAANMINGMFCGHVSQGMTLGERVADLVGIAGIPVINVENACASSSTALHLACMAVAAEQYDRVLVIGAEKMQRGLLPLTDLMDSDLEALIGVTVPSLSALFASRYASRYDLNEQDLAAVAVKNRRHAATNPYAQFRAPISEDEVLASPMVSTPLTRLMCCPTSDGAAAVIVASRKVACAQSRPAVNVLASQIEGGHLIGVNDDVPNTTARAAKGAYEHAGVGPEDVDLVEGLDYTSMAELLLYEDLGFCAHGEAARLLRDGRTALGGSVVFSPGGGLMSRGHPLGATGIAQVVEATRQLRGEATGQVTDAKIALTHAAGGVITGIDDEALVTIHLFGR